MATQTYAEIQAQIAELGAQAQKMKAEETSGIVTRIREDVAAYGLTVQDIFGRKAGGAKAKASTKPAGAKYSDGKGGTYGGRGPHPKWLRAALASGKKLEDFAAGAATPEAPAEAPAAAAPAKKAAAKKAVARKGAPAKTSTKAAKAPK